MTGLATLASMPAEIKIARVLIGLRLAKLSQLFREEDGAPVTVFRQGWRSMSRRVHSGYHVEAQGP